MKKNIAQLQLGQVILVNVVELQASGGVLLNYLGELLLVNNLSRHSLKVNTPVKLRVSAVSPLQFELFEGAKFGRFQTVA